MDEISELEKYKDLLDSGAISEEEFTQLKQKLLGLKTDEEKEAERQAERAEALKEIDALREAQKQKEEAEQQKQEEQVKAGQQAQTKAEPEEQTKAEAEQPEQAEKAEPEDQQQVQEEQIKVEPEQRTQEVQKSKEEQKSTEGNVKTQPNEEQKHEDAPPEQTQETQSSGRTVGSVIKSIILWIVCLFLIFLGIPSLMMQNTFYIIFGVVALLLAVLACPFITSRTKNVPALATFYQIKVPVVVVLVILAFVFMYLAGSSVS